MSSMFGNLAARFASSAENLATEAVAYMLSRSPAARRALNEMATILCPGLREARSFRTQYALKDGAIPDLAGLDQFGKAILLIENKFWAGLTPNQPGKYLESLPEDDPGLLLFIVPQRRLDAIWLDLTASAALAKLDLPPPSNPRAKSSFVKIGNRVLAVTSWQALLDQIEAHARLAGEADIVSDIGQLRGLCDDMDLTGYVPATLQELTNIEIPRRLLGLGELVQDVCDRAVASKIADAKGLRPTHFWYGAGRYLRIGAAGAWVGIDHRLWSLHGVGPLWITFTRTEYGRADEVLAAIAPWIGSNPVRAFDWEGAAAIPLRVIPNATRDVVLDSLHAQIGELHDMLKAVAVTADAAPPGPPEDVP